MNKRTISYCAKDVSGTIHAEYDSRDTLPSRSMDENAATAVDAAMEATVFAGWIYDHLRPHAAGLKVAHPLMPRRQSGGKKRQFFSSIKKAISYCGLCGANKSSANTVQPTPISKQRNRLLQTTLIEAAKMAPRYSPHVALLHDQEKRKGNANRWRAQAGGLPDGCRSRAKRVRGAVLRIKRQIFGCLLLLKTISIRK